jgi:hypothetical protein
MVLRRIDLRSWTAILLVSGVLPGMVAGAQEIPEVAPVLNLPEEVFAPTELPVGGGKLEVGGTARIEYDSNIYAQAFGEDDDTKLIVRPYVALKYTGGRIDASVRGDGNFRKYFKHDTESAAGGQVRTRLAWSPSVADQVVLLSGWQRGIEDRGEPEARKAPSLGPRKFDAIDTDLSYNHQGARIGFSLRGTAAIFRYTDPVDRNRNLESYAAVTRGKYRVSPLIDAFVEGFVNKRDFAPTVGENGLDRDSNTWGARLGAAIDPGGTIHGEFAFGLYHFDPVDARLGSRTGPSAQANLIFQPVPRTAVTVDAFIGNVATYQAGARSRQDTRVRIGIQQEIRHNLRAQAGLIYRQSRFFGSGEVQDIYGGTAELEYLVNRRLILAADVRYNKRSSTDPLDKFSRLRAALTLKFHY